MPLDTTSLPLPYFLDTTSTNKVLVVKNPPANARDIRDMGSIPGLGRSPGEVHGNPHQYSFLENPLDRIAWSATVDKVTKSWTRLKPLSMHACITDDGKR